MSNLKLGPLPKLGTVRVTVTMSERLKEELDLYAAEYARLYGQVDTATLIPHMLEAFLRSDRGWRGRKVGVRTKSPASASGVASSTARDTGPIEDQ